LPNWIGVNIRPVPQLDDFVYYQTFAQGQRKQKCVSV
jgi:hypothetical protein